MAEAPYRWYWRRYRTRSGGDPVGAFLRALPAVDDAQRVQQTQVLRDGRLDMPTTCARSHTHRGCSLKA